MIEIYVTDKGKKVPLEEAIALLTDDFIVRNSCNATVIDLVNAARQLREELARKQIAYKQVNELLHACNSGSHIQLSERLVIACNKVRTLTTALAASKDALQTCHCLEPEQREAVANALARIAECEKG